MLNKFRISLVLLLFIQYVFSQAEFPCSKASLCLSSVTQSNCVTGEFLELDKSKSCCPQCRKGLGNIRYLFFFFILKPFVLFVDYLKPNCSIAPDYQQCAPGLQCELIEEDDTICMLNKSITKPYVRSFIISY